MLFFDLFPSEDFIHEIEKIIWIRWRMLECSTQYGWLVAEYSMRDTLSNAEVEMITILLNKLDHETCSRALEKIRKTSSTFHPKVIPILTITILDEYYTMSMFRKQREKSVQSSYTLLKDQIATIFTISR